ncbi:hypothetical protein BD311DRAFT_800440 [Dichomitus squalens]|uniref:Uncharacterized protein n=1 Tax=Dichomitus squalens TaxID=114155 RepID=A0A4Q9M9B9_9APHY|nr:hypothetical protein BD311DRAFT_800440 [Dichomitus squalens]
MFASRFGYPSIHYDFVANARATSPASLPVWTLFAADGLPQREAFHLPGPCAVIAVNAEWSYAASVMLLFAISAAELCISESLYNKPDAPLVSEEFCSILNTTAYSRAPSARTRKLLTVSVQLNARDPIFLVRKIVLNSRLKDEQQNGHDIGDLRVSPRRVELQRLHVGRVTRCGVNVLDWLRYLRMPVCRAGGSTGESPSRYGHLLGFSFQVA